MTATYLLMFLCVCLSSLMKIHATGVCDTTDDIAQLRSTVATLQSQLQTQAQTQAAMLTGVLSQLRETTDDLNALKTNYTSLEKLLNNYEVEITKQSHNNKQLEHSVSVLQSQLKGLEQNLSHTKHEQDLLKRHHTTFQTELAALKGHQNETEIHIDVLQSDLQLTISKYVAMEANATSMNNDISGLQSILHTLEPRLQAVNSDVAFQAKLSFNDNQHISLTAGSVIKFQDVLYSEGNAFDKTTGYFTASVNGTYMFWVSVTFSPKHGDYAVINTIKNGKYSIGTSYGSNIQSVFGATKGITVTSLNKGDTVHFYAFEDLTLSGQGSFCGGALLHPH